ncbi:MAG: hypothetical protein AAFW73_27285, partial [Bacteroidota bacterium]
REAEAQKSVPEAGRERYVGYWKEVLQRLDRFKLVAKQLLESDPDLMLDKNVYHLFEPIPLALMPSPNQQDPIDTRPSSRTESPPPPPPPPPKQALEPQDALPKLLPETTMEIDLLTTDPPSAANPSAPITDVPDEPVQSPMVLSPSDPLYADLHPLSPSPDDSPMSATEFDEVEQGVDDLMLGLDPEEAVQDEVEEREDV